MPAKVPLIPVRKDADDHYRYKMPRLTPRTISSGNGIKTSILNAKQIAKAIFRTSSCLTHWFGYALAVQSKPTQNQEQIVLNGDHDAKKLQNSLYEFIDNFVLCPVCQNPETICEHQGPNLVLHCNSCGNNSAVQSNKSNYIQKMIDWYISHIPSDNKTSSSVTQQQGAIDKIDEMQKQAAELEGSGQGVYINVDELTLLQKQLEPKQGEQDKPKMTPTEAENLFNKLKDMLKEQSDTEIYKELQSISARYDINAGTRMSIVFHAAFDDQPNKLLENIVKHRQLFIVLSIVEKEQKELLGLFCLFISEEHKELMSSAPIIFFTLYDNEIIEETVFKDWLNHPSRFEKKKQINKEMREIVKPFLKWLDDAETEPDSPQDEYSDDDDHEEETANDDKVNDDFIDDI